MLKPHQTEAVQPFIYLESIKALSSILCIKEYFFNLYGILEKWAYYD